AAPVVLLLYGQQWVGVTDLLPLASSLTLVHAALTIFVPLLIAAGATRDRLICDAIYLVSSLVALSALAFNLSTYMLACTVTAVFPTLYAGYAVHREGWIDARGVRDAVIPVLAAAGVGFLVAWPIWQRTHGMVGAIGAAIIFVSIYILALRVLFSLRLDEL